MDEVIKSELTADTLSLMIQLFNLGIEISSEPISAVKKLRIKHLNLLLFEYFNVTKSSLESTRESLTEQINIMNNNTRNVPIHLSVNNAIKAMNESLLTIPIKLESLENVVKHFTTFITFIKSGTISETVDPTKSKHDECAIVLEHFFEEYNKVCENSRSPINGNHFFQKVPSSRVKTVKI